MKYQEKEMFPTRIACREQYFIHINNLVSNLQPQEISTGCRGAIEITRVAIPPLVQILLKGIEDILHTSVDLQIYLISQVKGVTYFCIEIEEKCAIIVNEEMRTSVREYERIDSNGSCNHYRDV